MINIQYILYSLSRLELYIFCSKKTIYSIMLYASSILPGEKLQSRGHLRAG